MADFWNEMSWTFHEVEEKYLRCLMGPNNTITSPVVRFYGVVLAFLVSSSGR